MKNPISNSPSSYLRLLLIVPALGMLGFAGCSSVDTAASKNHHGYSLVTESELINPESANGWWELR